MKDAYKISTGANMVQQDIIGQVLGNFGPFQFRTVMIIFLCKIPAAWFMAVLIFTGPEPELGEYICQSPSFPPVGNETNTIKLAHPIPMYEGVEYTQRWCGLFENATRTKASPKTIEPQPDETLRLPVDMDIGREVPVNYTDIVDCDNFGLRSRDVRSIITDFDLVCGRAILVALTQTFHLLGVLCGGVIATIMLNSISPRRVMLIGMLTQIVCGNVTGFVVSYIGHLFFRCASAACCALSFTAGAVIFSDITAGKPRTIVVTLHETYWSIGVILLPVVAGLLNSWSLMYVAISTPTLILVFLHRWIPDAPRWLLAHDRIDEARLYIMEGVAMNKGTVPQDFNVRLEALGKTLKVASQVPAPSWTTLFKGRKAVRHTVCVHWCWAIYLFCYYGTLLNIRTFGREYLPTNTAVAGLCEILGTVLGLGLILFTERKWFWAGIFNIIGSLLTCLVWITPAGSVALPMLTAMFSKTTISLTLAVLTTCTAELVTADKKKLLVFSAVVWGRIWFMGAPLIGAFNIHHDYAPQTIYAVISLVGGVLSMLISSPRTIPKQKSETPIEVYTIKRSEF